MRVCREDAASLSPARPPAFGGLCLMLGALAAAGVGWTAACVAQPQLLEGGVTSRLLAGLCGGLAFGAVGAADDLVRLRRRQPLGLRRGPRLLLEAGAAALVMLLLRGTLPPVCFCLLAATGSWVRWLRWSGAGDWWRWQSVPAAQMVRTARSAVQAL